jgi:hypothetical protein
LLNEGLGKVALSLSMPCLEGYNHMVGAHEYDNMSFFIDLRTCRKQAVVMVINSIFTRLSVSERKVGGQQTCSIQPTLANETLVHPNENMWNNRTFAYTSLLARKAYLFCN